MDSLKVLGPFPGQHASLPICKCDFCQLVAEVSAPLRRHTVTTTLHISVSPCSLKLSTGVQTSWLLWFMNHTPGVEHKKALPGQKVKEKLWKPPQQRCEQKKEMTLFSSWFHFFVVSHKVFVSIYPLVSLWLCWISRSLRGKNTHWTSHLLTFTFSKWLRKLAKSLGEHSSLNA